VIYHVMLCVFLTNFFPRFLHSLHISSHSMVFVVSSFVLLKFLCFLEYWNICWLEYSLEILCMKILFYLCVGLILLYLCLMNSCIAYIFLLHPFDSRLKYHIIFGTNRIWFFLVMIFLEIFLVGFGSGIWHLAAPSTMFDRWILWKINFELICSKFPKVLAFEMSFFP